MQGCLSIDERVHFPSHLWQVLPPVGRHFMLQGNFTSPRVNDNILVQANSLLNRGLESLLVSSHLFLWDGKPYKAVQDGQSSPRWT